MMRATVPLSKLPPGLRDLRDPPSELHVHGTLPLGPVVAVVGTRRPSSSGEAFAEQLGRELARAGVVVASGGAEGIDSAAHRGALDVPGRALVVAPCGFERPYPECNAKLFRRVVAEGGAYVSELSDARVARRHQFFRRNSILAALSQVVVIVESPLRSGARNAALWARRLGRPLLVVPYAPWHSKGRGNLEELRLGARLLTSTRDVLDTLSKLNLHALSDDDATKGEQRLLAFPPGGEARPVARPAAPSRFGEHPGDVAILALLRLGALHLDDVAERLQSGAGLDSATVLSRVTHLCLDGVVELLPGGTLRYVGEPVHGLD